MATATTSSIEYIKNVRSESVKTSSVVAYYSDPDLLIRGYFLSSPERRTELRTIVAHHIGRLESVFAVLSWGASGKARDGFDGAVNLLAEISDLEILRAACQAVGRPYLQMHENSSKRVFAENFLEILIKAVACAYRINPIQRLRLLTQVLPSIDHRIIKVSIIDALTIVSDEADVDLVKVAIERFSHDPDQYVCEYALEAFQDIG